MPDLAIRADKLSKQYRIGAAVSRYKTLRESLASTFAAPFRLRRSSAIRKPESEILWALKDVSFEIRRGEAVGIVGANGAGKSTLLKILARITEPTSGCAEITGRVASLLEVGTGFHPELTGRENIFLSGAILGMTQAEIRDKFDEIIAFAEIEKFIDTPVKHYSSGMYMRLAFSVAAHMEPEILLVDEVLAVGDAAFQKKCLGKMRDVVSQERTVFFVSHNLGAVQSLCSYALLLEAGKVKQLGTPADVIQVYLNAQQAGNGTDLIAHPNRRAGARPMIAGLRVLGANGAAAETVMLGDAVVFEIDVQAATVPLNHVVFGLSINNQLGQVACEFNSAVQSGLTQNVTGKATFRCVWEQCMLVPGHYSISVACRANAEKDVVDNAVAFSVMASDYFKTGQATFGKDGIFVPVATWRCA